MKILVCGDRKWTDARLIYSVLFSIYSYRGDRDITIIHGAAKGADSIAGAAAKSLGMEVEVYPAQWEKLGKGAGYIRNQQMLEQNPCLIIAFHNNLEKSKGTADMIRRGEKAGIRIQKIKVVNYEI